MIARKRVIQFCSQFVRYSFSDSKAAQDPLKQIHTLLETNTKESIDAVANKIKTLEQTYKKQNEIIQQLQKHLASLEKSPIEPLLAKKQTLLQNVAAQNEEIELVKKRSAKQIENAKHFAISKFAKDLLDVADNLKKCAELTEKRYGDKKDDFAIGILTGKKEMFDVLNKYEIREFDPTGEQYDPNTQESMVEVPDPSKPNGSVAMTTVTGYMIGERLLRSAKVCVYRS